MAAQRKPSTEPATPEAQTGVEPPKNEKTAEKSKDLPEGAVSAIPTPRADEDTYD